MGKFVILMFWFCLFVLFGYGAVGFVDDYRKITRKNTAGLVARWKYFWLSVIALISAFGMYAIGKDTDATRAVVPFFKRCHASVIGCFILYWHIFLLLWAFGNAVNLTRWAGWLGYLPTVFVAAAFALIAWATGNIEWSKYLYIPYIKHTSELVIFCTAIVGAGLGFYGSIRIAQLLWGMLVH